MARRTPKTHTPGPDDAPMLLDVEGLGRLIALLAEEGYVVLGPRVRDGAVVYDEVRRVADLPVGWTEEQAPGRYRLVRRDDEAVFGFTLGPHAWKRSLFPPRRRLWRAERSEGDGAFTIAEEPVEAPKQAFLGVRACELAAIAVQDRVFMGGAYVDPVYAARRANTFIVAVNCTQAAATCFCASMDTGPQARSGFDLALTELLDDDRHVFLLEAGTETGRSFAARLSAAPAVPEDVAAARAVVARTAEALTRTLDTDGIRDLLFGNLDHPRWDEVASRCLACTNCTLVCPTCFCSTVEDTTDLTGAVAERWQTWDSCFTMDFSYIHGGSVRKTHRARYRQWLTHKLASWIDQFGTSGCVGCGRCITWCPVGIDLTEEVRAIRESADIPPHTTSANQAQAGR